MKKAQKAPKAKLPKKLSPCPLARTLEHVGEWWSILILRDAMQGLTRFDEFETSLGIAPNMLTRRLSSLVESGLLEKRMYSEKPPRHEYVLTERGRDFLPVMTALFDWGNRQYAPEGRSAIITDKQGREIEPVVVDRKSREEITFNNIGFAPGPAATESTKRRYQWLKDRAKS